jgi:hypothetical protein
LEQAGEILDEIIIEPRYNKMGLMPWFEAKTQDNSSPLFVNN